MNETAGNLLQGQAWLYQIYSKHFAEDVCKNEWPILKGCHSHPGSDGIVILHTFGVLPELVLCCYCSVSQNCILVMFINYFMHILAINRVE